MPVTSVDQRILEILGRTFLVLQKVSDKFPWGDGFYYLLMPNPNPSDLDGNDAYILDFEEKTNITDTSETLQIAKVFVFADLEHYNILPPKGGYVRAVVQGGIARTGETSGDVYLTKMIFDLGYVDSSGNFTSKSNAVATPDFHTDKTDYQSCSGQAWLNWNFDIPNGHLLALKAQLYGKVASGVTGKMKLCCSRGSYDSYLEF